MDSDLAESLQALKAVFEKRKLRANSARPIRPWSRPSARPSESLRGSARSSSRPIPLKVETVTPVERVRLFASTEIAREQVGFSVAEDGTPRATTKDGEWRKTWILIGQSSLLGDPYFLDVAKLDAEGDCPVFTAMSGAGRGKPRLCGSSFAQFLRILAAGMEVAQGFGEAMMDDDDEAAFREALGHKIKTIDAAALCAPVTGRNPRELRGGVEVGP